MDFSGNCPDSTTAQQNFDDVAYSPPPRRRAKGKGKKKTAISLFSGGGGLDIGVHEADFTTLACVELDSNACDTLRHNRDRYFPGARIINSDLNAVSVDALMEECGIKPGELDLLFGGPPCQTFSQIGKQGSLRDARGKLLFSMVEYAKKLMPRAILIENVKALQSAPDLNGKRGGVVRDLKKALEAIGYKVSSKVINSADFGVAQLRQRLFIVALQGEVEFQFPEATRDRVSYKTVGEALAGLPKPSLKGEEPAIPNHVDVTPAGDKRRISYVDEGTFLAKMPNVPDEIKGRLSPKDTTKFLRLGREKQSNTLRCGEIFFHPTEERYLTPREYMRLHGFPDGYTLVGPIRGRSGTVKNLDQHRQVANSVPPPVARIMAEAISAQLAKFNK
jgi:DNA-methyltransferase (dcm)